MHYPDHLLKLIALFRKLPGVGLKSAERFAFHLLEWPEEKLLEMSHTIENTNNFLKKCSECGCLIENQCLFCQNTQRNSKTLCIVATFKDVFAIEQTQEFYGLYHVLGSLLSPLQGFSVSPQTLEKLKERISYLKVEEVILALDSTLEGDATALFLKKELEKIKITTSRLALGLPIGSALDFIDSGTLARAFTGRNTY